ncbi:hypothetical protein ACIBCO_36850 [Streptomyces violascens]|uniref:hypothetical protein n=1 Tax=Streptomyces violascens TaxID=67381 RepID=UPI0037A34948
MPDEPRATAQEIELSRTVEPQTVVTLEDEAEQIYNRARELEEAALTRLVMESPFPAGMARLIHTAGCSRYNPQ